MKAIPLKDLIGRNVQVTRKALGLTQAELAEEMAARGFRWVRQTVQETEAGRRDATIEELLGLSDLFEVPPARLVGQLEPMADRDLRVKVGVEALRPIEVSGAVAREWKHVDQPSFEERRRKTLESRATSPGPIFLWEGEGALGLGVTIPPWSATVGVTLEPGVPYTARDEHEAEQLQAVIDEKRRGLRGTLRVIDRQEAYRIRRRLRGTREEG